MREIPLTRGLVAMVDDEDYERLSALSWYATPGANTFYAQRREARGAGGHRKTTSMHRLVLDMPEYVAGGLEVDHIDRNGLNNQRSNLRVVTHAGNASNRWDPRWLEDRMCDHCGRTYHPPKATSRFCSRTCFGLAGGVRNLAEARRRRWAA